MGKLQTPTLCCASGSVTGFVYGGVCKQQVGSHGAAAAVTALLPCLQAMTVERSASSKSGDARGMVLQRQ